MLVCINKISLGEVSGKIWIENNKLKALPDAISGWTSVSKFFVNGNELTTIPDAITACQAITDFYCNENKIKKFPTGMFSGSLSPGLNIQGLLKLSDLSKIYLNNNEITSLPDEIVELKFLELLYLNDNKIKSLPKEIG